MAPERDRQFRMNLSDKELDMLRELAEAQGLTASDYLRMVIRQEHPKRFGLRIPITLQEHPPEPPRTFKVRLMKPTSSRSKPKPKRK